MTSVGPPDGVRTIPEAMENATRLTIIRHGQAHTNVNGKIQSASCEGLTQLGRRQGESLARRLARTQELAEVTAFYSSQLLRAVETAAIIAPHVGKGFEEIPALASLNELSPGEAEGLTWEEYERRYPGVDHSKEPASLFAPGAESWVGFLERVRLGLHDLLARHAGQSIALVAHGGVLEGALVELSGVPADRHRQSPMNASLSTWVEGPRHYALERFGDAAHPQDGR